MAANPSKWSKLRQSSHQRKNKEKKKKVGKLWHSCSHSHAQDRISTKSKRKPRCKSQRIWSIYNCGAKTHLNPRHTCFDNSSKKSNGSDQNFPTGGDHIPKVLCVLHNLGPKGPVMKLDNHQIKVDGYDWNQTDKLSSALSPVGPHLPPHPPIFFILIKKILLFIISFFHGAVPRGGGGLCLRQNRRFLKLFIC